MTEGATRCTACAGGTFSAHATGGAACAACAEGSQTADADSYVASGAQSLETKAPTSMARITLGSDYRIRLLHPRRVAAGRAAAHC